MRLAATGLSAHARSAFPKRVRVRTYHRSATITAVVPTIQNPCVGTRTPATTTGCSPENAGIEYGWLPQTRRLAPSKSVRSPTIKMSMPLVGSRSRAGRMTRRSIAAPAAAARAAAPSAAAGRGQRHCVSSEYIASAPSTTKPPWARFGTPMTL